MNGRARSAGIDDERAARPAATAPSPSPAPGLRALLATVQRTAGNRAAAAIVAQRELARCAGPCACGGSCHDDDLVDDRHSSASSP